MTLKPDDLLLIQRGSQSYKLPYSDPLNQLKTDITTTASDLNEADSTLAQKIQELEQEIAVLKAQESCTALSKRFSLNQIL